MKKIIMLAILLTGILALSACSSYETPLVETPEVVVLEPSESMVIDIPSGTVVAQPDNQEPSERMVVDISSGTVVAQTNNQVLSMDVEGFPGVTKGYGLYGATVTIVGVYPGWSGSAPLTIVNGKDHARTFQIMLQQPGSSLQEGYIPFPEECFRWIAIENLQPKVGIGSIKRVSVTLSVPFKFPAEMRGEKYDVRILVEDWSQTGFIQTAYQQKWLIEFAE